MHVIWIATILFCFAFCPATVELAPYQCAVDSTWKLELFYKIYTASQSRRLVCVGKSKNLFQFSFVGINSTHIAYISALKYSSVLALIFVVAFDVYSPRTGRERTRLKYLEILFTACQNLFQLNAYPLLFMHWYSVAICRRSPLLIPIFGAAVVRSCRWRFLVRKTNYFSLCGTGMQDSICVGKNRNLEVCSVRCNSTHHLLCFVWLFRIHSLL